jgi:hypothetical protein
MEMNPLSLFIKGSRTQIMKCRNFQFDLLELHDPEDNTTKRCLRAFSTLPRFCGFSDKRNAHSEEIISTLKRIDKKAKRRFGPHWRKK